MKYYWIFFLPLFFACKPSPQPVRHQSDITGELLQDTGLRKLLEASDQVVVSNLATVQLKHGQLVPVLVSHGRVEYDDRSDAAIVSNVEGRIERLFVKSAFETVKKGQAIAEIYSPSLVTAQEQLLLIYQQDKDNKSLLNAAREKLILLGMTSKQVNNILASGKPNYRVVIYSQAAGILLEPGLAINKNMVTQPLQLKEGAYVKKGQTLFSVSDNDQLRIAVSINPDQQGYIKNGTTARVVNGKQEFRGRVNLLEPFPRDGERFLMARIPVPKANNSFQVGADVEVYTYPGKVEANWLPAESVVSLGNHSVVFVKENDVFVPRKVKTGLKYDGKIEVLMGLDTTDRVAVNGQFLLDSDSFVHLND